MRGHTLSAKKSIERLRYELMHVDPQLNDRTEGVAAEIGSVK